MKYDLIVVTAANRAQARGYRLQLRGRKGFLVVPDPGDRRVGSLGATVNVLRKILKPSSLIPRPPSLSRVLVCHSGGDAKRTPAYAANGKAFVPMPDGRPLLDHIVSEMEKLPANRGVTVCCGDVIPYLDAQTLRFAPRGVTGVAYPDGPWQAQRHGVYGEWKRENGKGRMEKGHRAISDVSAFFQKPKVKRGKFLIDTGILHFDWATAEKMAKLPIAGDIYEEFPKLLLEGFAPFKVSVAPACTFFHVGSSRELLKLLGKRGTGKNVRGRVLVDAVQAPIESLAGDNIVTNVPASYGPIRLGKGECLTSLPLRPAPPSALCPPPTATPSWYHLKYRIDDTFKEDGLWDRHELGAKMRLVDHRRLIALKGKSK